MILITGSAGFIGYHVAKFFLNKKFNIVGIDNINNYYDTDLKRDRIKDLKKNKKFIFYKIDISKETQLKKIFKKYKFKYVIHLAAQAGVRYSLKYPKSYITSNIVGFFNILNLSKEINVKHLIYASSSSVYGINEKYPFSESHQVDHPIQIYAATKRSNELMAHSYSALYNLKTTGLRFFTVYGPWGRPDMAIYKFTDSLLNRKTIYLYNYGKNSRDYTYIDDAVLAIYKIFSSKKKYHNSKINTGNSVFPYEVFNIGNNKKICTTKIIKILEDISGKKANLKKIKYQPGEVLNTHSSTKKAYDFFKFKSTIPAKIGIERFFKWYVKYYKK